MTIIVEDGSARTDSEAYITVAECDTYFAARNLTLWADVEVSEAEKEGALRRATDYMQQVYRMRWAGVRRTDAQALDWPRDLVPRPDGPGTWEGVFNYYPADAVPREVKHACAELAFRALFGELAPDVDRVTKREKVDVIEVEYAEGFSPLKRYRAVDNLLAPLFQSAGYGNSIKLVRT
jgi:hypothetical protein